MKKQTFYWLFVVGLMVTLTLAVCSPQPSSAASPGSTSVSSKTNPGSDVKWPKVISFAVRRPGSNSYSTFVPITNVLTKYLPSGFVAEPSGALAGSLLDVERGKNILPTADALVSGLAYLGKAPFKKAYPWLRMVLFGYRTEFTWGVRATSDIHTFRDLKGKRVRADWPKFYGFSVFANALLKKHGMTFGARLRMPKLSVEELITGKVDATIDSVSPRWVDADRSRHGLRFISFNQEDIDAINEYTGLNVAELAEVPPGFLGLKALKKSINAIGVRVPITASKDFPDEIIYQITKTIYQRQKEYVKAYHKTKAFTHENALSAFPAPFHKGSIRYFKEVGVWTAKHDQMQEKLLSIHK